VGLILQLASEYLVWFEKAFREVFSDCFGFTS